MKGRNFLIGGRRSKSYTVIHPKSSQAGYSLKLAFNKEIYIYERERERARAENRDRDREETVGEKREAERERKEEERIPRDNTWHGFKSTTNNVLGPLLDLSRLLP